MAIKNVLENVSLCETCGNACTDQVCKICLDPKRDKNLICVVEDVSDLWAIERTRSFKGVFHVLGGTLSAIESIGPEEINIIELQKRVLAESGEKELILALNATLEGQTTSHYIADLFNSLTQIRSGECTNLNLNNFNYIFEESLSLTIIAEDREWVRPVREETELC